MTLQQHVIRGARVEEIEQQADGWLARYLPQSIEDQDTAILINASKSGLDTKGTPPCSRLPAFRAFTRMCRRSEFMMAKERS